MSFEFSPTKFEPTSEYHASDDTLANVRALRTHYQELQNWSDLALVVAFGDYSSHIMAVHWADWLCDRRDEGFLAYLYVRAICPDFKFDTAGLHMDDVDEYAIGRPWNTQAAAPTWVCVR